MPSAGRCWRGRAGLSSSSLQNKPRLIGRRRLIPPTGARRPVSSSAAGCHAVSLPVALRPRLAVGLALWSRHPAAVLL